MKRIAIIALTASLFTLASCDKSTKSSEVQTTQNQEVLTKVAPVVKMEVAESVDFTTTLLPYKKSFITPQMSLRIDEISVEVGDKVKGGQVVAMLDKNQYNQSWKGRKSS